MRVLESVSGVLSAVALLAGSAAAVDLPPIIAKGKHFFYSNNHTQFFIRGVAYQQDYNAQAGSFTKYTDPLADAAACKRDIPWMVKLRTNTIRTYAIDPKKNHDACMTMLADAGIYVVADLSEPFISIESDNPEWNTELYQRYVEVVDSLAKYTNTIGFFAGNEVTELSNQTEAAAFVKAAVRDTKAYIKTTYSRPMYVGYATADVPIRDQLAAYFNCGDQSDAIDFWGYNVYSWCGQSSYVASQYKERTDFFRDYSVPVFFAEYGCNNVNGKIIVRTWDDTPVLYGPKMAPVFSGGIAYQYFETANKYGLVNIDGNTVKPKQDYINLSSRLATITPSSTAYTSVQTLAPDSCPPVNKQWSALPSPLPPSPNDDLCTCMEDSLSCAVKGSYPSSKYAKQYGFICGDNPKNCAGIQADSHTGTYGAFSTCTDQQKLSYVMDQYYLNNGRSAQACDFNGAAATKSSSKSSKCNSLLSAAGKNGGGSVPSPTASGGSHSVNVPGPNGGSSSGGSGGSGGSGAAGSLTAPAVLQVVLYVSAAAFAGAVLLVL